jgi:hypothetical protein
VLLVRGNGNGAVFGELVGVARQVEQCLAEPGLVGVDRAEVGWTIDGLSTPLQQEFSSSVSEHRLPAHACVGASCTRLAFGFVEVTFALDWNREVSAARGWT